MSRSILLLAVVCHLLSVILFLHGFLWNSTKLSTLPQEPVDVQATHSSDPSVEHSPRVDKVVLFLIDALRSDFVFGNDGRLRFVAEQLQNGKAKGFIAKAETPTVTLPRLKALTTGAVPSFIDVILNFGTQATVKDNFIDRMSAVGRRVVFYGDDTWLRMFPNAFSRSEGVTSFLVSDYTEVDDNVTHNVVKELERDDWDVMILHYLGLDHIGHLYGPHSSLVAPKLREMDGLIENIARHLERQGGRSLLIVLGDHGMTDAGNHGGGTQSEVDTPMVFISPSFISTATDHVAPSLSPPLTKEVKQVDLASTMSLLMNTPVMTENTGVFVLPVLRHFLDNAQLQWGMCRLASQLSGTLKSSSGDSSVFDNIKQQFCQVNSTIEYKEISAATESLRTAAATQSAASSQHEAHGVYGVGSMELSFLFILISMFVYIYNGWRRGEKVLLNSTVDSTMGRVVDSTVDSTMGRVVDSTMDSTVDRVVLAGMVFHAVSLASSSFIEEEHQLWYMWMPSAYLALAVNRRITFKAPSGNVWRLALLFVLQRVLREWNRTGDKWLHLPDIGDWLREPNNRTALVVLSLVSVLTQWIIERDILHFVGVASALAFHTSQANIFAWTTYLTAMVQMVKGVRSALPVTHRWRLVRSAFFLTASVIVRPHNLPLLLLVSCTEELLSHTVKDGKLPPRHIAFLYFLHGWCTFYFFGNSNAISSVDVSAGFAGMTFYCAPLHALFIFLHVYIGPLFFLFSLLHHHTPLSTQGCEGYQGCEVVTLFLFFRLLCLGVAFVNAALQRHHLFVWTVFAPKVLYESVHSTAACFFALVAIAL